MNHQGEDYDDWTMMESVRTARGPRQRVVATLGKLPGLDPSERVGWEQIADFWYGKTALDDLLGLAPDQVNEQRLYRGLDALLPHKDGLFKHFRRVYGELFGTTYDLLLYDITSTYFEGQGKENPQARRGDSRDSRPDCVQVAIALVVTPEGLPLAYEVFDGKRAAAGWPRCPGPRRCASWCKCSG